MLNNTSWDQQLSRLNTNNKRILKVRQMYWIQFRCMEISFYAAAVESYRCVRRIFSISLLTHRWAVECRKLLWVYGYESPKAELSSVHEQISLSHSIRCGAHKHAHSIGSSFVSHNTIIHDRLVRFIHVFRNKSLPNEEMSHSPLFEIGNEVCWISIAWHKSFTSTNIQICAQCRWQSHLVRVPRCWHRISRISPMYYMCAQKWIGWSDHS